METMDLINAAISGDKEGVENAFNAAIAAKVSDALEVKKVEVASNLITPQESENENEPETVETEVDGSSEEQSSTENEAE
jgi:hypothetical protein